ncbi:ABC transporter substrate-binding protein [Cohnella candidum]|uniref:ABC transporter substrate-binding protein n=1 Tax=Cohnella candidum TaxID=2674991 RepID=A0A3G3JTN0_9BACL|nr:ABC transporter substrate-binding protein [Cohnella candidum]AYQ71562.1 ABC transporter substrate-binding protein [Cohnella candidum]
MSQLSLTLACADYDRIQALADGSVQPNGIDLNVLKLPPDEIFRRMLQNREFDVSELSASNYLMAKDQGTHGFTALPVFLSRTFRHPSIYIRTDSGISGPEHLRGKRIGVPEYHVTALVWVRGMLQHQYGIHPFEIEWFWGGVDAPGSRQGRIAMALPPGIRLTAIGEDQSLNGMLKEGEIDAIISPRAPASFLKGESHMTRLFPDYKAAETDYYRQTGIFPIMHFVVIRDEILERHPWTALNLFQAFLQAKEKAYRNLEQIGSLRVMLPWLADELEQTKRLMGPDYWSYGIARNKAVLETLIRYSFEQGLIRREIPLAELFAHSTLAT